MVSRQRLPLSSPMPDPRIVFRANIQDADALAGVYDFLTNTVGGPLSFDDLLRSKLVYAVSAFDKFIHDLVRVGMVEIFVGKRPATPKYLGEPISLHSAQEIANAVTPPPEVVFEQVIRERLRTQSFQDPDKVADGLSYIWPEPHKWRRIASAIGSTETATRTRLKLIVARRNSIVHEADLDPISHSKLSISKSEADDVSAFLLQVGNAIGALV